MARPGSVDRNVVGHYNRQLWPHSSGVRLVAAVMRIALVEKRVIDDEIGVLVSWKQALLDFGKEVKTVKKEKERSGIDRSRPTTD
jgi:hypothetical protein